MDTRFVLLFLSFFLFACNNDSKREEKKETLLPPKYYYYPRANVYFDSANKDYIFLGNDGKTWQTEKQIPAAMQLLMDKNAYIENPPQPVWKDNEQHKLLYSALLYTTYADTVRKKETTFVKKPAILRVDTIKKKERKGVRKFFDKLFSRFKKNKDKEEKQ